MTHEKKERRILIVGATGFLGGQIVLRLSEAGRSTRAVTRTPGHDESHPDQRHQIVTADLKDRGSLEAACRDISVIVSTATATRSRREGDSIETVDRAGHMALIDAAEAAGVQHFVYLSFPPCDADCAFQRAKRAVESRLAESRLSYTVIQAVAFSEAWLGPAFGFDPAHGQARILGDGTRPLNWVSLFDVARFAAAAVDAGAFTNRVFSFGGPDALSPLQVVALFERLGAPKVQVTFVPEHVILAQLADAKDPLEEALAAGMLATARGCVVDSSAAYALLGGSMTTAHDYAQRTLKGG
jgi:uncharacterized protein YbjT (DUF2867 family)